MTDLTQEELQIKLYRHRRWLLAHLQEPAVEREGDPPSEMGPRKAVVDDCADYRTAFAPGVRFFLTREEVDRHDA